MADRSNEQIVLETVLEQRRTQVAPDLGDDDFFEVFAAEQVLKSLDLSYDELTQGIVDGGDDGGIDAFYVFVNGQLIQEDSDPQDLPRRDVIIEVHIIQAKNREGFKEAPVGNLALSLRDLLNLDTPLDTLQGQFNEDVLLALSRFRETYLALASAFPRVTFRVTYASRGVEPHPKIREQSDRVLEAIADRFSAAQTSFDFLGASELLASAREAPPRSFRLAVAEAPISTGEVGFIGLVGLAEFANFVTSEDGELSRDLFDANVRDYQGSVEVNKRIHETLTGEDQDDFWWLNNGITIVAKQASLAGKTLTLDSPQVVNGLQTSTEIFEFFKDTPPISDERHVLVRVVVPESDESRDRIIRATNDQTPVPSWALRATDPLQRHIEEFFRTSDLYYDRRKNFHKNQGVAANKIISIAYLGQAMMAIALGEPNNARARPSSLIKSDADYARVFNPDYPIQSYLNAVKVLRQVEHHLTVDGRSVAERNNLKYHVAYYATAVKLGREPSPVLLGTSQVELSDDDLSGALASVIQEFSKLADPDARSQDQIAKGNKIVPALKARLETVLNTERAG